MNANSPVPEPQLSGGVKPTEATCPQYKFQALDISGPVDQKFLDHAKHLGVTTIIRYGDHVNETIKGKTPKPAEIELLRKNGFAFMAVFQHNNRWATSAGQLYGTFRATRGKQDAERMQELYPQARSWYYGVDFDAQMGPQMNAVEAYAVAFKKVADKYGKPVGVYGSGRTLDYLEKKGLIKYKWLSMSTGFGGTAAMMAKGNYHLLQKIDKVNGKPLKCGGRSFDPDIVKEKDFGQWMP